MTQFLKQLNDAAFAGHTDWRLPTSAGSASWPTGQDPELESLLRASAPCGYPQSTLCIDPIFSPAMASYWSSSTVSGYPYTAVWAWTVFFVDGSFSPHPKAGYSFPPAARAVRGGP